MKRTVTILTDIPDWTHSTVEAMKARDWAAEVIDVRKWRWTASEELPDWSLVFNRIAARPASHDTSLLTKTRDLLAAVDLAGIPCLNGPRCHSIGASKALQASLFAVCGVPGPKTEVVCPRDLDEAVEQIPPALPFLIKPNVGGRGRGISSPDQVDSETFAADGCGILQEKIAGQDGRIHRVEMLAGEVLYEATVSLEPDTFDYCLAGADEAILTGSEEVCEEVAAYCRRIAKAASLDLGSIEYLLDRNGTPRFIDINPVSSFVPRADRQLGVDPFELISALLAKLHSEKK